MSTGKRPFGINPALSCRRRYFEKKGCFITALYGVFSDQVVLGHPLNSASIREQTDYRDPFAADRNDAKPEEFQSRRHFGFIQNDIQTVRTKEGLKTM